VIFDQESRAARAVANIPPNIKNLYIGAEKRHATRYGISQPFPIFTALDGKSDDKVRRRNWWR